jgi:ferredoxin-2, mitochondrial
MLTELMKSRIFPGVLQGRPRHVCTAIHSRRLLSILRQQQYHHQQYRRSSKIYCKSRDMKQPRHSPSLNSIAVRWHGDSSIPLDAPTVNVTFLQPDGTTRMTVPARIGESLLETAHRNEIDLEGACEGVCACSTCHLILPHNIFKTLPEASENEEDMLDMAFGLTETSRLGCQIKVTSQMEGIVLEMPKATRNFYVDGHKPKPH